MTHAPRYATLSDYLRVLRRRRLLILLFAVGGLGLALANSLVKDSVYVAETQIQFRDPLSDLNIVGISGENIPELNPSQRSALNAALVTRPEVTRRAQETLDTTISEDALQNAVSAAVDPQTNLVDLEASWGEPQFAADLANAYAEAAREDGVRDFRQRLDVVEDALKDQLKEARQDLPQPGEASGAVGGSAAFRVGALEQNLTQVRSLSEVADPVQIADRAQVPGAPASPRPVRDAILGFVVGLVVGLLIAFTRDALDRRLYSAQEVHDELEIPVIGRIGAAAFAYAGLAKNGHAAIDENEFEPFRVLRTNLGSLTESNEIPRSVLVTSAMAGEGKSTVSMALASAAGLTGQRVLLIEGDLRKPSLARRMGLQAEPGLADYLSGSVGPAEIVQVVALTEPARVATRPGNGSAPAEAPERERLIACITAGTPIGTAPELLQSPRLHELLEQVRSVYDLVVIDAPPLLAVADPLEFAPHLDALLICVRAQQTTHEQARAVRSALGHIPERPAGAVLTGLHPGDESYGYYYGY